MATQGIVDHGALVREFADPNAKLAETEWERKCQGVCRREAALVAELTGVLRAIDANEQYTSEYKAEQRKGALNGYMRSLEAFDTEVKSTLDKVEAEAEGTLSRPLSIGDPTVQVGQQRLIDLYSRSMDPADLVAKFRTVVTRGTEACQQTRKQSAAFPDQKEAQAVAAAWCEYVPALLAARDREEHDPGKAMRLHGPMREAQRIAAEFLDTANPLREKARQTLADVKRVRLLVGSHRLNRARRHLDNHPAFRELPGHTADSITHWSQWR